MISHKKQSLANDIIIMLVIQWLITSLMSLIK